MSNKLEKDKNKLQLWVLILISIYMIGSVIQNILATKTIGSEKLAIANGSIVICWLVFASLDIINEVWGRKRALQIFTIGTLLNIFFSLVIWVVVLLPGVDDEHDPHMKAVLGSNWRIVIASSIAYFCSNYLNATIVHRLKEKAKDHKKTMSIIFRLLIATLVAGLVDSVLFDLIAFAPVGIPNTLEHTWNQILQIVLISTGINLVMQGLISPLFAHIVKKLRTLKENVEA